MKIVVLVKHVPEPTAAWRYAEDLTLDRGTVDGRLSELDEYAVEQAVTPGREGCRRNHHLPHDGAGEGRGRAAQGAGHGRRRRRARPGRRLARVGRARHVARARDGPRTHRLRPRAVRDGVHRRRDVRGARHGRRAPRRPAAHLRRESRGGRRLGEHRARVRRRDAGGRRRPARSRVGHRPDAGGALPRLPGDHGRQEEARRDLVAGRPRRCPPTQVGAAATAVRECRTQPPRQAGTVVVDDGDGAVALADFLVARQLL